MLVFVLLGVTILQDSLQYDFYLITMTSLGCILARFAGTVLLSLVLNIRRPESDRISWKSQIIIWNAGLRGAVAYALAVSSSMPRTKHTNLMITTVHASVIFTILFHGLLTFPLVKLTGMTGQTHTRTLSEPRPARKKMHSLWSRLDKTYIIPFISYPRPTPEAAARAAANESANVGFELDERDSSLDVPDSGRFSYDGFESNPNNLDTSLFEPQHELSDPRAYGVDLSLDSESKGPTHRLNRSHDNFDLQDVVIENGDEPYNDSKLVSLSSDSDDQ